MSVFRTAAKQLLALCAVVTLAAGCGAAVKQNPSVRFPLTITEKDPALLFPIDLSGVYPDGDPLIMGTTVAAGVTPYYGGRLVAGQPAFELVGNLSHELAEAIRDQAHAGAWTMTGPAERVASGLANLMDRLLGELRERDVAMPADYRARYVIALHTRRIGDADDGSMRLRSWGGIYDNETRSIVCYTSDDSELAGDQRTLFIELPRIYQRMIDRLLRGAGR